MPLSLSAPECSGDGGLSYAHESFSRAIAHPKRKARKAGARASLVVYVRVWSEREFSLFDGPGGAMGIGFFLGVGTYFSRVSANFF